MPLAHSTSGMPFGMGGRAEARTPRSDCAGVTASTQSAPASAAAMSVVAAMPGASAMPGR